MGFWFYSSDVDLETKVFRVMYEDNFMITVITDTNLFAYCFIGLEFYDILGKTNTKANLLALIGGTNDATTLNFKKFGTKVDEKKWRYIRCGYSYASMKFYIDVNYEGFPAANLTEETLKRELIISNNTFFKSNKKNSYFLF